VQAGIFTLHLTFRVSMRQNFFTVRLAEHWNRLTTGVVESPSLETFTTCLDALLCDVISVFLLRQREQTR